MFVARFVDSISPTRSVRMDLNDGVYWRLLVSSRFDPPRPRRARVSTLLTDGATYPASSYDDRVIELRWILEADSPDVAAAEVQRLGRELDRPGNILEYQPNGTTRPVFFHTKRLGLDTVGIPTDGARLDIEVNVPADPFAYGLEEVLPAVSVDNDPAGGTTLNSNPYFETNVADWTATGGTFVRSTAQFHQGVASGLLTPDGVTSTVDVRHGNVAAVAGRSYRASVWVRCASARNVGLTIAWRTSGDADNGTTTATVAVAATTWTRLVHSGVAPASTALVRFNVNMGSTPPASDLLYIDEATINESGAGNAMYLDVTGVKGDVEAPVRIVIDSGNWYGGTFVFATRRHGVPGNVPFVLRAEEMNTGTDTSVQSGDALMSGGRYLRITFATSTSLTPFRAGAEHPPIAVQDARGQYRVYMRVRRSSATGIINVRFDAGPDESVIPLGTPIATALTTGPRLLDLGLVSIPFGADPVHIGPSGVVIPPRGLPIEIHAERVTGSSTLDIDYLLFVPADDLQTTIDLGNDSAGDYVIDSYADAVYNTTVVAGTAAVDHSVDIVALGGLPMLRPDAVNRLYVIGLTAAGGDAIIPSTVEQAMSYWPRYLNVRPVNT